MRSNIYWNSFYCASNRSIFYFLQNWSSYIEWNNVMVMYVYILNKINRYMNNPLFYLCVCVYTWNLQKVYVLLYKLDRETIYIRTVYAVHLIDLCLVPLEIDHLKFSKITSRTCMYFTKINRYINHPLFAFLP